MLRTIGASLFLATCLTWTTACGDDDRGPVDSGSPPEGGASDADTPMDSGSMDDAGAEDAGGTDAGAPDGGSDASTAPDGGGDAGAPSCSDGVQNGDETDVDCGGTTCEARCEADAACSVGGDCESRVCIGEVCIAASCSDGIQNGDETDRDCGGGTCDGCALGRMCMGMDDCADATAMCTGGYCQPGSCADGEQNNAETDVDCGGGTCAPCSDGEGCALARDCASSICMGGVCLPASCTNGMMDAGEVAVDCGGPCAGCPDGTACTAADDCASGRCEGDVCTSCDDGTQNGAETDVDCGGGVCPGCPAGSMCTADSDCLFGDCLSTGCNGPSEYYRETFESDDGGWTTGGTSSSWEYGEPANTDISAAYGGTMAWVTNLTGDYNSSEMSWIQSPLIDLSAAGSDPILELALNYDTESCCDEGWIEVSTDGTTWTKLGTSASGIGWYNDDTDDVWNGSSSGWRVVRHHLTGLAGESAVYVRVVMSSDSSIQREGLGVDNVVVRDPIPVNLQVTAEPVADICGGIVVSVTNVGDETVASYTFEYGVGGTTTSEPLTDLAPGGSESRVVFGSDGDTVYAEAVVADDLDLSDNTAMATIALSTVAIDASTDYVEDFDSDDGGWLAAGTNPSWEHGTPSNTLISAADSGTSAWVTNLTGDYNSNESSYLVSPCIDATGAPADIQVSFAHLFETESCCDEGWMEYSVDGGRNWLKVPDSSAATNWYNDTSNEWWDGTSDADWRVASAPLPGSARKPRVRFRFVLNTDSSVTDEGFGVDTFSAAASGEIDLSVEMRRTATCGTVEAVVRNVGTASVSAYALTTEVDGAVRNRTIVDPLGPGGEQVFTLMGTESASATVRITGDVDTTNDSDDILVAIPIIGGFAEDFDTTDGGFTVSGSNASWEHGEPMGSFISGPASGTGAWVTGLTTPYEVNELSYLTSPCFDMSMLSSDPTLAFAHIYETETCCDHGWVEISVDGGGTWNKLGSATSGMNWYDDTVLDWWNGTSGAAGIWRMASHEMTGAAGAGLVQFRYVMYSDAGIEADGFGVDDVTITP